MPADAGEARYYAALPQTLCFHPSVELKSSDTFRTTHGCHANFEGLQFTVCKCSAYASGNIGEIAKNEA
ncbi:hypothetical protein ACKTEK_03800 [Tepidamorphus sp. 3E244]|uniref:hypothetical protein n=1 Tax=Tepidamorphus sp. 3E244 TaxID=3385498 RepID=UPI0038FCA52E